jgi:hypothetical protein
VWDAEVSVLVHCEVYGYFDFLVCSGSQLFVFSDGTWFGIMYCWCFLCHSLVFLILFSRLNLQRTAW